MSLSDAELLDLVRQGRFDMFDTLVVRYRPRLLRFAQQTFCDSGLAEDLVQETFSAVFAARDSFNPKFAFSTWIWTILLNLCRRERRRRRTLSRGFQEAARRRPVADVEDAAAVVERQEAAERLRQMLDDLPAPQADALRLRFFGALSFDDIAAAMNSSVSGAKSRVRKGLAALASRLSTDEAQGLSPIISCEAQPESRT